MTKVEQRFTVVGVSIKGQYIILQLIMEGQRQEMRVKPIPKDEDARIAAEIAEGVMSQAMTPLTEMMQMEGLVKYDALVPVSAERYASLGKPTVGDSVVLVVEYEKLESS